MSSLTHLARQLRSLTPLVWIFLFAAPVSCRRPSGSQTGEQAVPQAPPAAPSGLLGELFIPHPERTWSVARATMGAANAFVPDSLAAFLGGAISLPLAATDQLDLGLPIVGAIVDGSATIDPVIAIHVKDPARLVQLLTHGTPRFTEDRQDPGVILMTATSPEPPQLAYGIAGNFLVISHRRAALLGSASYLARSVAARAMPSEDLVITAEHRALAGPILSRLKQLWQSWKADREAEDIAMRNQHGGSAPDFGDPAEALADIDSKAARLFAVLADLGEAQLALTIEPEAGGEPALWRAVMTIKPTSQEGPAAEEISSMPVADAAPLLSLPISSAIALFMRDTPLLREQSSKAQVDAIAKILGGRLDGAGKTQIDTAFAHWSRGRGDWLTAGFVWGGNTKAAVIRGAVANPEDLRQGAAAMLKLLDIPALAGPLSNWVGSLKISGWGASPPEGVVQIVHVLRRPPKLSAHPGRDVPAENDSLDVMWSVGHELLLGAAGRDAKTAYSMLQNGGPTLADLPSVAQAIKGLGNTVSFALIVDSAKLGGADTAAGSATASPVLLCYGKDAPGRIGSGWLALAVPAALVTAYAGSAMAGWAH